MNLVSVRFGFLQGLCFIRTSRPESNIIYNCNEDFHVGQAKVGVLLPPTPTSCTDQSNTSSFLPTQVVYKTNDDHVTVVGAGVTLHEALAAAEQLKKGSHEKNEHESIPPLS